jgi:Ca-activated chloride channel family protein
MPPCLWLWSITVLLFFLPLSGVAQGLPPTESVPTFGSTVDLVSLAVRVSDRKDNEVPDLPAAQFSVYENGIPQKIGFFSAEQQPISLGILLDVSSSMATGGKLDEAKRALTAIVNAGHPGNEWLFLRFHREVETAVAFTRDRKQILAAISSTRPEPEGTSLYDAVAKALCMMKTAQHLRQALIVITDGADQHSHRTLQELIPIVQAAHAQLFMIGCFGKEEAAYYAASGKQITLVTSQEIDNPHYVFERLAQESGAEYFFPASPGKMQEAMDSIARQLRTQYSLAYYPRKGPGYRRIEVRVALRGSRVRARRGFVLPEESATPDSRTACDQEKLRPYPYEARVERQNGCVVYREDFRSTETGWPNREHYFLAGGAYHLTSAARRQRGNAGPSEANSPFGRGVSSISSAPADPSGNPARGAGFLVANGPWLEDTSAQVTVETKAGGGPQAASPVAGLAFRINDAGYYAVLVDHSSTRSSKGIQFKLIKRYFAEEGTHDLLPWTVVPVTALAYAPRQKLAVTSSGKHIRISIQGVLAGEIDDNAFDEGMTGMVFFGKGSAEFQDLQVTELCHPNRGSLPALQ